MVSEAVSARQTSLASLLPSNLVGRESPSTGRPEEEGSCRLFCSLAGLLADEKRASLCTFGSRANLSHMQ